jgi:hypothetical protein
MEITRRALLKGCVGALAATCVPGLNPLTAAPALGQVTGSRWLIRSTYVPLVGSTFSAGTTKLKLAAVRDLPSSPGLVPSPGCFSLLFDGPPGLRQGSYPISHVGLGSTVLFVVPVGPPNGARQPYEIVVNRP